VPILTSLQSAAMRLIGRKPTIFFGVDPSLVFETELCDLALDAARDMTRETDWQQLIKIGSFTGDGTTTVFAKPIDFDHMLRSAILQDTVSFWGYRQFLDMNEFIYYQNHGFAPWPGGWAVFGNQFNFVPAPTAGSVAQYPYVSNYFVTDVNGAGKAGFSADTDTFILGDRLMILALVWRWRQMKKMDWQGDKEIFDKAFDEAWANGGGLGPGVVRRSAWRHPYYHGVQTPWPWTLGAGISGP
jgi:hypothetical protein